MLKYTSLVSMFFIVIGCSKQNKPKAEAKILKDQFDKTIPGNFSQQSDLIFDSTHIANFFEKFPDLKDHEKQVRAFYRKRNFAYAWFEDGILIEQAGNLASKVMSLENEGVFKPLAYHKQLDSLLYGVNRTSREKSPDILLELILTAKYFHFSQMAWEGMAPSVSKINRWHLPRKKVAYDQYLDSLLKKPSGLPGKEPVYRQYGLLKTYLKKYRRLEQKEPWLPIAKPQTPANPGESTSIIPALKKRLFNLEDYQGDTSSRLFDNGLVTALKNFQERNGLNATGTITKETIDELNIPLKSRIQQILVNMERSRWLPVKLNSEYLAVNIPEYRLHVYRADSLLWSSKAVVGKTDHPTSLFYGEIKYLVFRPYWNIPPGILNDEILPAIKKNRRYLAQHNMEITGYQDGLPVIRQKPGPSNPLGLVKFLFPNSYNIYLHDIPVKTLFNESSRAFSHGCIRIEEPAKLAAFLLKNQENWTPENIEKAMQAGKERYVTLKTTVPVYIAYFTAFVDRKNKLNFRKDIYRLDDRLAATIIAGEGAY